jgi:hypothetical protein
MNSMRYCNLGSLQDSSKTANVAIIAPSLMVQMEKSCILFDENKGWKQRMKLHVCLMESLQLDWLIQDVFPNFFMKKFHLLDIQSFIYEIKVKYKKYDDF